MTMEQWTSYLPAVFHWGRWRSSGPSCGSHMWGPANTHRPDCDPVRWRGQVTMLILAHNWSIIRSLVKRNVCQLPNRFVNYSLIQDVNSICLIQISQKIILNKIMFFGKTQTNKKKQHMKQKCIHWWQQQWPVWIRTCWATFVEACARTLQVALVQGCTSRKCLGHHWISCCCSVKFEWHSLKWKLYVIWFVHIRTRK